MLSSLKMVKDVYAYAINFMPEAWAWNKDL
jgi:hypothetical protein